ncbi:MAG: hypothetical protein ABSG59_03545 [Verrucomicrobiota bacterium]|jgi:hypothetical protein
MNEGETELLAAVGRVAGFFDALGVEYLVGGSMASSVFGEPRQTLDADLLARLLPRHAEPLVRQLSGEFYADLAAIRAAIQTEASFNLIHLESMTKVDVFLHWRTPFAQSQFARRRRKLIGDSAPLELFFASPEDTILSKLERYRQGGAVSERQWRDLLGVLKVQAGALDQAYLSHWAGELGVSDLLDRARDQAGLNV